MKARKEEAGCVRFGVLHGGSHLHVPYKGSWRGGRGAKEFPQHMKHSRQHELAHQSCIRVGDRNVVIKLET